jgi:hypothetical protein
MEGKEVLFDDKFIQGLPEDPTLAAKLICESFLKFDDAFNSTQEKLRRFDLYLNAVGFVAAFTEGRGLDVQLPAIAPEIGADRANLNQIVDFFEKWRKSLVARMTRAVIDEAWELYRVKLGRGFSYQFSEEDFDRVQHLLNELRELISKSRDFEEDHKRRLLKRLEKLQAELHKKMSSLDMLWGLIGDAGVALGKFGKNAKPFTDRIGEILQIVCRTQAKAENLEKTLPLRLLSGEAAGEKEKS